MPVAREPVLTAMKAKAMPIINAFGSCAKFPWNKAKISEETIIANTGSLSLPKNQSPNSYIILTEKALSLKDLSGKTIKEIQV